MLMIYSYPLYKENIVFRWAEHTYIAVMLAVNLVMMVTNVNRIAIQPMLQGQIHYIIPIILGLAMYTLLVADYRWISRYPIAVLVGAGFGLGMRGVLIPNLLDQVVSTITPPAGGAAMDWFNFIYIAIGTICAVSYFLLTYEHTGALRYPTRLGRWFIMIGLGAYFGNTVLFRLSMLSGRAQFFLQVLKIIPM
ncbi:hypothetical protein DRO42_00165 [Candidatus Bathyarchaeota archaeon]|nr:MAG: hypothetical protein DRO42_00165 [Candidatus Bathyarchaeota archaeon]